MHVLENENLPALDLLDRAYRWLIAPLTGAREGILTGERE